MTPVKLRIRIVATAVGLPKRDPRAVRGEVPIGAVWNGGIHPPGDIVGNYIDTTELRVLVLLLRQGTFSTIDFPGAVGTFVGRQQMADTLTEMYRYGKLSL
jgi:hypothetical protein